jgi:hypothetical protein
MSGQCSATHTSRQRQLLPGLAVACCSFSEKQPNLRHHDIIQLLTSGWVVIHFHSITFVELNTALCVASLQAILSCH